jgi:hypothetical protein
MKLVTTFLSMCLCLSIAAGANAQANQKRQGTSEQVAVDQLPQAVTSSVLKSYPSSKIVTAYKLTRGTDVRYELWVKETPAAQAVVMSATADGQLLNAKGKGKPSKKAAAPTPTSTSSSSSAQGDPIAVDQLPKAVTKAIKDSYPKDAIIQAFKTTTGADVAYQVVLNDVASVQALRVFVSADGKILKR